MTRLPLVLVILFASVPRASSAQSTGSAAGDSNARQAPTAAATPRNRPPRNYNPAFTGVYYPDAPEPEPAPAPAENGAAAAAPAPGDSAGGPASGGSSSSAPAPAAGPRVSPASRSRAADTGVYYPDSPASGATVAAASNKAAAAVGVYHPDPPPVPPPGARETRVAAGDSGTARTPHRGPMTAADTLLASACGDAPGGSEAPGLLAVLFRARTTEEVRHAAAKQVGGTIAGESDEGEDYVRFPPDAGPPSAVADRLIRLGPVMRVSPVACPGPAR